LGGYTTRRNCIAIVTAVLLFVTLFSALGVQSTMFPKEGSATQSNTLVDGKLFLKEGWAIKSSKSLRENGAIISTIGFSPVGWYPTSVPSTVLAALVENGVYTDPYFGMNLTKIPDLTRNSWWYRTEFVLPTEYGDKAVWLHFNGINYKANIWLNGLQIADSAQVQGMHRLFEFEITSYVTFAENNCLAVEVFAPTNRDLWDSWVDWNPTPPDKDMGIWQDVYLKASGPVVMRHPYVVSDLDLPSLDVAHLNISAELTNLRDEAVNGVFNGAISNVTNVAEGGTSTGGPEVIEFSQAVSLGPNENKLITLSSNEIAQLNISNPRLWWPNLVGLQNLYDLKLEFDIAGEVSDNESVRFGIREVYSYLSGQYFRIFQINGQNILIRGGGWVPDMMFRPLPEIKEAEIKYARDMNLNAIRMEGKLETNHVWDLCDKYGIMVLAGWCCCCHWEEWNRWDATDITVAMESQKDQLLRLRNHPSLLVWLYASDLLPPPEIEKMYLNILNTTAPTLPYLSCASYRISSITGRTGVKMWGPYSYEPPVYYYLMESPGGAWGFGTEMGPGENVPPIESMREMLPEDHLWPIDRYWNYHCGSSRPFNNLRVYTNALDSRYGEATGVEDYCRKAQLMNYESMRAELEAFGRNKYVSTGVITWQFNSAWPSLIWQHYDYSLRPGGAYFGAKKACEPLHVQYSYNESSIYVINSYYESFNDLNVSANVYNWDMTEKYSNTATIDVGPDSSNYVFTIPALVDLTTTYFLALKLEDSLGNLISSNFYWLSTKPDVLNYARTTWYYTPQSAFADFTDLAKLPLVDLNVLSYEIENQGENLVVHVTLENPTDDLAFFIHLAVTRSSDGKDVLPILWDANYFSLLPGESKEVDATFAAEKLNGAVPVVKVEGWNIATELIFPTNFP